MTLIVALKCTDGVVIAADSASTDLTVNTKQPATKIHQLGQMPLLVGGTGDVGVMQKTLHAYQENIAGIESKNSINALRKELKKYHRIEEVEALQHHIGLKNNQDDRPLLGLLFAGIQRSTPFIMDIHPSNTDTVYDDDMGGFYAVGSGAQFAHALYRPFLFELDSRTVEAGKVQAFRIIDDAIELSHAFLAAPIHIYSILTSDRQVVKADDEEISRLRITCELWRQYQRDSLNRALNPSTEGQVDDIPVPSVT